MRIHIAYSDRHYRPNQPNPRSEWFSCAQIARHTFEAFIAAGYEVTYGDAVPEGKIDLLWTSRILRRTPNVGRMIYFAPIAHWGCVRSRMRAASGRLHGAEGDGFFSDQRLSAYTKTLLQSDRIVLIGNQIIQNSFSDEMKVLGAKLVLIECGVDTERYTAIDTSSPRANQFVHTATSFSVRKGTDCLVGAWAKVADKIPEARLMLLGREGDVEVNGWANSRADVELAGDFVGGSVDYIQKLSSSRWVVLPSVAEGQAGTLLEAMACGCVPIATRASGVDAECYGGAAVTSLTPEALADAMLTATRCWDAESPAEVRNQVCRRHGWADFRARIVEIVTQAADGYSMAKGAMSSSFLAQLYVLRKRLAK